MFAGCIGFVPFISVVDRRPRRPAAIKIKMHFDIEDLEDYAAYSLRTLRSHSARILSDSSPDFSVESGGVFERRGEACPEEEDGR